MMRNRFPGYAERFRTVHNAASMDLFYDGCVGAQAAGQPGSGPAQNILFMGAVSPEKGSHVLLEAFEKTLQNYPEATLTMAGPVYVLPYEFSIAGSEDAPTQSLARYHQGDAWQEYIRPFWPESASSPAGPRSRNIRFTGLLPQESLPRLLAQADIFVFPSVWNEPFGMPVVEAMAAGKAVVTTRGGGLTEIIDDGRTGLLVDRGDSQGLAEAISRLLADEELRLTLGANAGREAVDRFSFHRMAAGVDSVYQAIA
jgi:glycosyltransferase involved in cell wall biosynthesis